MMTSNLPYRTETKPSMFSSPLEAAVQEMIPYPSPTLKLSEVMDNESVRCIAYKSHQTGIELRELLSCVVKEWYDARGHMAAEHLHRQIALSKIVRTDHEIKAEMAELRKLKKEGAAKESINAQLLVLRDRLSHEEAGILFEDSSNDVEHAALDACDWLVRMEYRDSDLDPDEKPSVARRQRLAERKAAA